MERVLQNNARTLAKGSFISQDSVVARKKPLSLKNTPAKQDSITQLQNQLMQHNQTNKDQQEKQLGKIKNKEEGALFVESVSGIGPNGLPPLEKSIAELNKDKSIVKKSWCGPTST